MARATHTTFRWTPGFFLSTALWLVLISACVPIATSAAVGEVDLRAEPTARRAPVRVALNVCATHQLDLAPVPVGSLPLRGDPDFDPEALAPTARCWYDALWSAIDDPNMNDAIVSRARSDDLYEYSRPVHTHVVALLMAFRATGDLALLDEVARLAEFMRSRLRDPWRRTADGSDGTRDGYLNWVFGAGTSDAHQGKDLHPFDEMRAHALVAEVAWALHHNRDLTSPNGFVYGDLADFWAGYLVDDFEEKWRERNGVAWPKFPFLEHESLHATVAFVKYHHYVGALLGSEPHHAEARRLSRDVLTAFSAVSSAAGTALVWPRTWTPDGSAPYLQPTTYVRYVVGDVIDLHLEGVGPWADPDLPVRLAATIQAFVLLDRDAGGGLARDVGGGEARGGIAASDRRSWDRLPDDRYAVSLYAAVARWDRSGEVAAITQAIAAWSTGDLRTVHLPSALLLATSVRGGTTPTAP